MHSTYAHRRFGAQQGMNGAKGLCPPLGDVIKIRHGGKILIDIGNLHRAAAFGGFVFQIAHKALHHLPHFRLDDEYDFIKAGPDGIINGILHQNLAVGADAVHLLAAAVAGRPAAMMTKETLIQLLP